MNDVEIKIKLHVSPCSTGCGLALSFPSLFLLDFILSEWIDHMLR